MWKTSSGWQAERLVAVLLLIGGLYGCAGPMPVAPRDGQDIVTASDEGDLRRRARIRLELASTYYSQGQFTTALDELKQAIAIDPRLPAAHEMRALIYDAMGDAARADDSFRQALLVDPNNGSVLHNNAWSLCRRGQYESADALFARAAGVPSGLGSKTLLARGVCQQRSGDLKAAEKTLLQAYELDPSSPATAFNLAAVLLKEGELERARFYIRRVNNVPAQVTAESLWLAARVEHRLGNLSGRDELAEQLRRRFTGTREATALELGRFDE
jgi:type IV pilus assembly protein PilF